MKKIEQVAKVIKESKRVLILTGAGMSTESGLPDYRGSNGMWRNHECAKLMTLKGLFTYFEDYTTFTRQRVTEVLKHEPNAGHLALATIQKRFGNKILLATQNVDGFHTRAGSANVAELHGRLIPLHCVACKQGVTAERYLEPGGEFCPACRSYIRPGVVMFHENLPVETLSKAQEWAAESDAVIACGTSLQVYPASHLLLDCPGVRIIINKGETALDHLANIRLEASLAETWVELERLTRPTPLTAEQAQAFIEQKHDGLLQRLAEAEAERNE